MKKLLYMMLALILALSLASCGRETAEGVKDDVNKGVEDVKDGAEDVKDDLEHAGNNIKDTVEMQSFLFGTAFPNTYIFPPFARTKTG